MINNDVTAAICTKNAEANLELCLKNLKKLELNKIIAVDAESVDKTQQILKSYEVEIFNDFFKTLGGARSIAVDKTKTKYILFLGPDNLINKETIKLLKLEMNQNNWIGIAPLQKVFEPKGYLLNSLNIYKSAKITTGAKNVIGTPQLYLTEILKKNNYNPKMHYSDDTELGDRLNNLNFKIGVGNAESYEIGEDKISDIFKRWRFYGKSDRDFHNFKKKNLSIWHKLKSLISPLNKDFLNIIFSNNLNIYKKIFITPFLFLIVFSRYIGWFKS